VPVITAKNLDTLAEFVIAHNLQPTAQIASDGASLVWVNPAAPGHGPWIMRYDLNTGQAEILVEAGNANGLETSRLALADGVLYYTDAAPGHQGLYAWSLASRTEQRISETGRDPVAPIGACSGASWSPAGPAQATGKPGGCTCAGWTRVRSGC
jgi:hypothetical protein